MSPICSDDFFAARAPATHVAISTTKVIELRMISCTIFTSHESRRASNPLNLEMRSEKQRPRPNKRAGRQRLRKICPVHRIEPVKQRHIRAENLHVNQILHREIRLRERGAKPIEHQSRLLLNAIRNLPRREIEAQM